MESKGRFDLRRLNDATMGNADEPGAISTHFISRYELKDGSIFLSGVAKMLSIVDSNFSTIEDFKAKLKELYDSGKGVEVYYKLAEPLVLDCTDEQIAVLNELENMITYADKTIITIDNDLSEMTVEVEQSRMSMIENKLKEETIW